jgi:predicted nucleic acid-binding Zn ribbon protein
MAVTNKAKLKRGERIKLRAEKLEKLNKRECPVCGDILPLISSSGRRSRSDKLFCSQKCHDIAKYQNDIVPNNLKFQAVHGFSSYRTKVIKYKLDLIMLCGGECSKCGYNKNLAAFDFHHRDPSQKLFEVKMKNLAGGFTEDEVLEEVMKCDLLCANCHRETHSPYLNIENLNNFFKKQL